MVTVKIVNLNFKANRSTRILDEWHGMIINCIFSITGFEQIVDQILLCLSFLVFGVVLEN